MRLFLILLLIFILQQFAVADTVIPFDGRSNLRQSYNDCAIFCIKAVLVISGKPDVSVKTIKSGIKWRMKNNYTLPAGLEESLRKYGIRIKTPALFMKKTSEKIIGLKNFLKKKSPVIILVGYGKFQHYMTLLGYNDSDFYVYDPVLPAGDADPNLTIDQNGNKPGNRNIRYDVLIDMWDKGGMYGLYKNYFIVCRK